MIVDILTWNPIHTGDFASNIKASVYIKPTIELLDLFNKAPLNRLFVKITNTEYKYDNIVTYAFIDKSSDIPNKRQNLFDCSGLYVVTLAGLDWSGYPTKNGKIEFVEGMVEKTVKAITEKEKPVEKLIKKIENKENKKEKKEGIVENFEEPTAKPSLAPVVKSSESENNKHKHFGFNNKMLLVIGLCLFVLLIIAFVMSTNDKKIKLKK